MIHNLKPVPIYHQKCHLNIKTVLDYLNKIDYEYISKNDNYFSTNSNYITLTCFVNAFPPATFR